MKSLPKRVWWSIGALGIALLLGYTAYSYTFSDYHLLYRFPVAEEILVDVIGILGSALAIVACVLIYPFRTKPLTWLFLGVAICLALALAFEYLLGFIWFASDKFVPFGGQPH